MPFCYSCGSPTREEGRFCGYCGANILVAVPAVDPSLSTPTGHRTGTLVGNRYLLGKEIGQGGFGVVFEAEDLKLERKVAVKTIHLKHLIEAEKLEAAKKRFIKEAQAAGRLTHANIISILDSGIDGDISYLVMEHVEGTNLEAMFEGGARLPVARASRLLQQLLDALVHAHRNHVVHRDIKPSNLIITQSDRLKLADFGTAKLDLGSRHGGTTTAMGPGAALVGSPAFMSPEAVLGNPVDERTDLYGAAVVAYILFTGRRPFEKRMPAVLEDIVSQPPPDPVVLEPGMPDSLRRFLLRGLEKIPASRFPSAEAMAQEFQALQPDIIEWIRALQQVRAKAEYDALGDTALEGAIPIGETRRVVPAIDATPRSILKEYWLAMALAGMMVLCLQVLSFLAGYLVGRHFG